MAVTFLSNGASAASIGTTLDVPYPSTVNADDYLVMMVFSEASSSQTIATPSGWTLIDSQIDDPFAYAMFGRVAVGTESGSVEVTMGNSGSPNIGHISRYGGVSTSSPTGATVTEFGMATFGGWALDEATVTLDDSMAVAGLVCDDPWTAEDSAFYYSEQIDFVTYVGNDGALHLYTAPCSPSLSPEETIWADNYPSTTLVGWIVAILNPIVGGNIVNGVARADNAGVNGVDDENISKVIGTDLGG